MRIERGAPVTSADGCRVGVIERLLLNPTTGAVLRLALRPDGLRQQPVEIAPDLVEAGPDGPRLRLPAAAIATLPPFYERVYTTPPTDYVPPAGITYDSGPWLEASTSNRLPIAGRHAVSTHARVGQALYEQDLAYAVIGAGASVHDRAGATVGVLQRLAYDADTGRLAEVTLRHGRLRHHDLPLPASLIARFDDGLLHLTVSAAWLHAWDSLQPGVEVWTSDRACLGTVVERAVDGLLVTADDHPPARVPMIMLARVDKNRALLNATLAQARLWTDRA